jgi:hypothetical protein
VPLLERRVLRREIVRPEAQPPQLARIMSILSITDLPPATTRGTIGWSTFTAEANPRQADRLPLESSEHTVR